MRGVSDELTAIEAAERQADFGAALYTALGGAPPSPAELRGEVLPPNGAPRPDEPWTNRRMRQRMLEDARWLAQTPCPPEERERWRTGRGDGRRWAKPMPWWRR